MAYIPGTVTRAPDVNDQARLLAETRKPLPHPWMGTYVNSLRERGSHTRAAQDAGISREHAWRCRRHGPIEFAQACWAALELYTAHKAKRREDLSFARAYEWRLANGDFREPGQWRDAA